MALFLDASALVKRYVNERGTRTVVAMLTRPEFRGGLFVAEHAEVEVVSALAKKVRERLHRELGLPEGTRISGSTSRDLFLTAEYSPYVAPMSLWPLPAETRAKLLTQEVVLGAACHPELWSRMFGAEGLTWREDRGAWMVARGSDPPMRIDSIEVVKLTAAVALLGTSPRAVASNVAAAMG